MSTKTITDGYMYVSGNGQLVIDKHPSDEVHLLSGPTSDVQPLHDCRTYLKDLIPTEWLGRRGLISIERAFDDKHDVASIKITFMPDPTDITNLY